MDEQPLDPMTIAAVVLGGLSVPMAFILAGAVPGAVAIFLGAKGLQKHEKPGPNRMMSGAGLGLGSLGVALTLMVFAIGVISNI